PTQFRIWSFMGSADGKDEAIVSAIRRSPPERIIWSFRTQACRVASEGPNWDEQPAAKLFRTWGVEDIFFVNGVDPLGAGCFFTAKLPRKRRSTARDRTTWSRIAAHLASGFRLQRRLAAARPRDPVEDADAVLEPSGKVQHADDAARSHAARQALKAA